MNLIKFSAAVFSLMLTFLSAHSNASDLNQIDADGTAAIGKISTVKIIDLGLFLSSDKAFCVITGNSAAKRNIDLATLAGQIEKDEVNVTCSYGKPFELEYKTVR